MTGAIGVDLGGTKIETQLFDGNWEVIARQRVETPHDYPTLLVTLAEQVAWADALAGVALPVGIGSAGVFDPTSGRAMAANLPMNGAPFLADAAEVIGRQVHLINDARAFTLSEAVFGAGQGYTTVLAVVLGTGVGGGVSVNGALMKGPTAAGGEIGHTSAPAAILQALNLPVLACGCGRTGCFETYVSGPGMSNIAEVMVGHPVSPSKIADERDGALSDVWDGWCALAADLLRNLILTVDPDVIVLGGGLSCMSGVEAALTNATSQALFQGMTVPPIVVADGGDASGARGAAYAAWQALQ